jgi:hypothetical protein
LQNELIKDGLRQNISKGLAIARPSFLRERARTFYSPDRVVKEHFNPLRRITLRRHQASIVTAIRFAHVPRWNTRHDDKHDQIGWTHHNSHLVEFGSLLSFRVDAFCPTPIRYFPPDITENFASPQEDGQMSARLTQVTRKNSQKKMRLANHLSP